MIVHEPRANLSLLYPYLCSIWGMLLTSYICIYVHSELETRYMRVKLVTMSMEPE